MNPDETEHGTAQGPADAALEPKPEVIAPRAYLIVFVATLSTAAYAFMWNSITVALPHMMGAFAATTDQITWVMIAYIVGSAVSTASVGWFTDRFGRRKVFLFTITGFAISQLGCGMAGSLEAEVFWRMVQGITGAPLVPLGQVLAVTALPGRHTQATSLWAIGFIAANVISPTLAGYVIDWYGWPWIFYASIPVTLTCLLAAFFFVPETDHNPRRMDWFGFLSLIIGLGLLQLMLARGERLDWFDSPEIVVELLLAGILLYLFAVHTRFARNPFIARELFVNWNFILGLVFVFLVGCVLYLPMLLLPLQLEQLAGYPPDAVGELMMARGVGTVISLSIMSRLRDRVDLRWLMLIGLAVTAMAIWSMSTWSAEVSPQHVMVSNFIMGAATGSIWAPMNTMTLAHLPKRTQDQGFALFYLMFDVGNAIGTAVLIAMHTRHSQIGHALLSENVSPFRDAIRGSIMEGGDWSRRTLENLFNLDHEISRQALAIAYNNSYFVASMVLVAMIPLVLLYRKHKNPVPHSG
ncbi:MAG: DHA2 family efflux MFS transporter permease subunit [Gammaproteobacteria bacterium]|nr:DHA2 family efflux MFS transporter permease subunit [Gammaproteobacteria bacterium]